MTGPTFQITFDAADPDDLSRFWTDALGYKPQDPPEGFATWDEFLKEHGLEDTNEASAIVDPEGKRPQFYFQKVPEAKMAKNRVHLDINIPQARGVSDDERKRALEQEAERLMGLGATRIEYFQKPDESWIMMNDPEGNEFCLQ